MMGAKDTHSRIRSDGAKYLGPTISSKQHIVFMHPTEWSSSTIVISIPLSTEFVEPLFKYFSIQDLHIQPIIF
jgi:hypothetical protein